MKAGAPGPVGLVRAMTRRSGSNFYYAFLLLPREKREAIYAVYAFAREVDDAVDEAPDRERARERLAAWDEEVELLAAGRPRHPVMQAVARARAVFPIPLDAMRALCAGARMDLERQRYATFDELRVYCERVASAVGLMCIEIFRYRSERAKPYAVNLGIALQLTNILRDLGTDARRGRIYVPLDEAAELGVSEEEILSGRRTPASLALFARQAERARGFYRAAESALDPVDLRSLVPAEVMRRIYAAILDRIEASSFDVYTRRVGLSRPRKAAIAVSTWLRSLA